MSIGKAAYVAAQRALAEIALLDGGQVELRREGDNLHTDSGVAVTVGQARLSWTPTRSVVSESIIGKKIMSSGFFLWCTYNRLCTWGIPTLLGKQGSMAPRLAPSL